MIENNDILHSNFIPCIKNKNSKVNSLLNLDWGSSFFKIKYLRYSIMAIVWKF